MAQLLQFIGHHWVLCSLLVVLVITLIRYEVQAQAGGLALWSATQATYAVNHNMGVILDLRPEAEFTAGHILGAVSLPVAEVEERLKKFKKYHKKPVILCTATGALPPAAAKLFKTAGFEQVSVLKGGLQAWRGANLPITSILTTTD
jgi:rhodanese-related sulfurtransferase